MRALWPCIWLVALAVSGCAVGPDYARPDVELPEVHAPTLDGDDGRRLADLAWFDLFEDETLERLVQAALADNLDLRAALARLLEAQARGRVADAALLPNIVGALQSSPAPGLPDDTTYTLGAALAWELDVFGKLRRGREAARAEILASEDGARAVTVGLVGAVTASYFRIRELDALSAVIERTIASQEDSLALVTRLQASGVVSAAEGHQARALLASTRARLPELRAARVAAENALAVLLGRAPGTLLVTPLPEGAAPALPAFSVALPTELLADRPDIRAAEQRLHAATARVGVAIANRFPFPTIGVTALAGRFGTDLGDLLDEGDEVLSWGPTATLPLLDFGRTAAAVAVADARLRLATQDYRRTVLVGLQETSDALAALEAAEEIIEYGVVRVEAASSALRLQRLRFRQGVVAYIEVLDAERQLLAASQALTSSEFMRVQRFLELYRALGGGADEDRLQETLAAPARSGLKRPPALDRRRTAE